MVLRAAKSLLGLSHAREDVGLEVKKAEHAHLAIAIAVSTDTQNDLVGVGISIILLLEEENGIGLGAGHLVREDSVPTTTLA